MLTPAPLRPPLRLLAAVAAAGTLLSSAAFAQASLDQRYRQGFDVNVLDASPAGDRFFSVADADSPPDHRIRLVLLSDIPTGAVLRRTDNQTGRTASIIAHQWNLHAGVAYPVTGFLDAHLDVPFVVLQNGDTPASPTGGKLGDPRVGLRANVLSPKFEPLAFGPAVNVRIPIGSEDNLAGDGRARLEAKLAASGRSGPVIYAASGGYLVRKKVDTQSLEYGDAVTFGAAVGVALFHDVIQVGPEFWGSREVNPLYTDSRITFASAVFGAKARFGDFVAGAAVGPGLTEAPGVTPRLLLSVALAPDTHVEAPPVTTVVADRDGDGVLDAVDSCPDVAGPRSDDPKTAGCPPAAAPAPDEQALGALVPTDSDGDGIPDGKDACPDKLGDPSDDPKQNGCPKPRIADADGDGIRDELDACPNKKGAASSDPKTTGCPPSLADSDGDGVLDRDDACPSVPGEPATDRKANGCPPSRAVALAAPPPGADDGSAAAITFTGFDEHPDGSSRLYVKLTRAVAVQPSSSGTHLEYLLEGTTIPIRNNQNPLITSHFGSQVVSARLVGDVPPPKRGKAKKHARAKAPPSDGGAARLVVETREAVTPESRMVRNPDGSAIFIIDFAKPSKTPPPEPDVVAQPRPRKASEAVPAN